MTDVFTTAHHAVAGADIEEGDTVLVVGDGAVGLLACHAARLLDPAAIVLAGHHDDRPEVGRRLGATHVVNTSAGDGLAGVLDELTDGFGPRAVIDAVSSASSMRSCVEHVQPGGTVSWVGMEVFLAAPELPWDPSPVLTQDLTMDEAAGGYAAMAERREGTVKVAVSPNG